ncbi:DUF2800 domain-containing protein [Turicimonas muris]|uniref:DUF2800 domain-containing protein n=1 Tax=Turicimonas muris TaxID=1796652 RepID=UPI0024951204|nr:DUF2800 domain-containing protein [Turicimonas muris]
MTHAVLSPSSSRRWMTCPGSVNLERMFPNESSSYAEEGTLAHAWAAFALDPENQPKPSKDLPEVHRPYVLDYVEFVKRETEGGLRQIEFKVDLLSITGEAGAKGTIDCASLVGNTLKIIDFKFGQGVLVSAQRNSQLLIYALAASEFFSMFDEIKEIEMTIFQPRMDNIDTWKISMPQAEELAITVRAKAAEALAFYRADPLPLETLKPHVDACRFCRAKAACPKLRETGAKACDFKPIADEEPVPMLGAELMSPERLAENMQLADFLEPWIAAVREEAHRQLMNGNEIPGFKLVLGRPGNRQWTSAQEAEEMLKGFKLREAERYTFKVISPTQAEKLMKVGRIGERQWKRALEIITRAEPQPTVVPETDKREAWQPTAQSTDFSPITN